MPINAKGYWEGDHVFYDGNHCFDSPLADQLVTFFKHENAESIVDLGCGPGSYVQRFQQHGLNVKGFDGNPSTPTQTNNVCGVLDLSVPHTFDTPFEWVMSLEVGEHLPPQFEDAFIGNLHNNNTKGIVLSWALEGQGGYGHFNCRNNDYVKAKFAALGYKNDIKSEKILRNASTFGWFKNTIMVFRK